LTVNCKFSKSEKHLLSGVSLQYTIAKKQHCW
jgi:hypothetical protein